MTTGDKIDALLGIKEELAENDLYWINTIDDTASEFEYIGFTPRQEEVIDSIYEKYLKYF